MTDSVHRFTVQIPGRADSVLRDLLPEHSRSRLQQLIAAGSVTLNGVTVTDSNKKIKPGDALTLTVPETKQAEMLAEHIPLSIVFEDEHLLVIDKPAGMTVHPGAGNQTGTLVNALLAHCGGSLSGIGGVERPGIVHRLDKDTSGLMVVAKHDQSHRALSTQLADRSLSRVYHAYAWGRPKNGAGEVVTQIDRSNRDRKKMAVVKTGGREAITRYATLALYQPKGMASGPHHMLASKIECRLATGRTHQIRVHLTHLGVPLIGDPVYGSATSQKLKPFLPYLTEEQATILKGFNRQALHAASIAFIHPVSGKECRFEAMEPHDLQQLEKTLSSCGLMTKL